MRGARANGGEKWGVLLPAGSRELFADLALCDVTCADSRTVQRSVSAARELAGEPWALLVDVADVRAAALAGDVRDVGLEARLRALILPDDASLARLGAACVATLTTLELRRIERDLARGSPANRAVQRAPALVRAWAEAAGAYRHARGARCRASTVRAAHRRAD